MRAHLLRPDQALEFNQAKRPKQWAFAILKMQVKDRDEALAIVPEQWRELVREIIEDQLWRQRHKKKREQK